MEMATQITECEICGVITFIKITIDGKTGTPSGNPDKHIAWHETSGR